MKPNIIVDDVTKKILAFGYCDFSEQLIAGQTQHESPVEILPDEMDVCIYDSTADTVLISNELSDEKDKIRKKNETELLAEQKADILIPVSSRRKLKSVSRAIKLVRKETKGNATQNEKDELDALELLDNQIEAIYEASDSIKDEIDLDVNYDYIDSPLWP